MGKNLIVLLFSIPILCLASWELDFDENFYSALPKGVIATGGDITN